MIIHAPPVNAALAHLRRQHRLVRGLFDETVRARGSARASAYTRLQFVLSLHEAVEGLVIHPAIVRSHPEETAEVVARRLDEERNVLYLIDRLSELDAASAEFAAALTALRTLVTVHCELEEAHEFPYLDPLDATSFELLARVTSRVQELCSANSGYPTVAVSRHAFSQPTRLIRKH